MNQPAASVNVRPNMQQQSSNKLHAPETPLARLNNASKTLANALKTSPEAARNARIYLREHSPHNQTKTLTNRETLQEARNASKPSQKKQKHTANALKTLANAPETSPPSLHTVNNQNERGTRETQREFP